MESLLVAWLLYGDDKILCKAKLVVKKVNKEAFTSGARAWIQVHLTPKVQFI